MNASKTRLSREGVRRRFERWRRMRAVGSRIPEPLWAAAVELAGSFGLHPTAKSLKLDYYSLKKRVEAKAASGSAPSWTARPAASPAFVELPAATRGSVSECVVELEDAQGAKMRIHFKGEAPDLAALSRSFWGSLT